MCYFYFFNGQMEFAQYSKPVGIEFLRWLISPIF